MHLLRAVGEQDLHPPVRSPGHRIGDVKTRQLLDPALVPLAAARPERGFQVRHFDGASVLLGELLETVGGAHLVRADRLMVVEQEDRHPGGLDQIDCLWPLPLPNVHSDVWSAGTPVAPD
ncbi:hypothetical protein GCM10010289_66160 [Streptomyces violascens]|uniref:Uncharacterized protein n=1 Tax=Streptomyces violascens TaxID=67381 RepID=A0ABQ3QLH2_9ACTN|nr:hypothetical protein GCM10010289_66160 [Streptomyces violascens]GHI38115.1 hypothetical protein Sviol_25230 [Streptomyces violascens]